MAMVELEPLLSEEMNHADTYHHSGDLEAHGTRRVQEPCWMPTSIAHVLILRHAKATRPRRAAESSRTEGMAAEIRKVMPGRIPPRAEGMKANADADRKSRSGRNLTSCEEARSAVSNHEAPHGLHLRDRGRRRSSGSVENRRSERQGVRLNVQVTFS